MDENSALVCTGKKTAGDLTGQRLTQFPGSSEKVFPDRATERSLETRKGQYCRAHLRVEKYFRFSFPHLGGALWELEFRLTSCSQLWATTQGLEACEETKDQSSPFYDPGRSWETEGGSFSNRMSTGHKDTESIFLLFRILKLDISSAIKDLFPFLEVLRDYNVISNKQYDDFQESRANLIPVRKVVYRVLEEMEKKHDLEVLGSLFCKQNMEAYPDLERIFQRFKNVLPQNELRSEEIERRDTNSQLSVEQGPGNSCSQESLTWSPSGPSSSDGWRSNNGRNTTLSQGNQTENHQFPIPQIHNVVSLPENGLSEDLNEIIHVKEDTTSDDIDGLQKPQATVLKGPGSESEESCELEVQLSDRDAGLEPHIPLPCSNERAAIPSHGIHTSPCSVPMENIKQENSSFFLDDEHQTHARTDHNEDSEIIDLTKDNSDNGHRRSEESTSVTGQSSKKTDRIGKYVIRNFKMPMDTSWIKAYTGRRINSSSRRGRIRGPRIPKQKNVDFSLPKLPVTCGTAKGTLDVEKFKKSIHEKSIQSETGRWLTPRDFEIKGDRKDSKNWRQSLRCYGWTLGELIKKGSLPNPQRKKEKLENSKQCMVCGRRRKLCPCDSCRKFYHKNCHIPPVENKSGPWSCVFCKIKDQAKCQENQAFHTESEVLKRKMLPEEQLKCELLLLTVYCHSKSVFFKLKPKERKEDFPALQEHMWLDKIKKKLNNKAYHLVQHFVADMRLIFRNHSMFYKNHRYSNHGVKVGSLFEETFKRTFSIQSTSK
ncbi:nuclear autoantigen Sp-100-like [Arvicola amphibius]|uniref:nuclear autoantigen Sp-100-like n=1 Tax=Arvicola amphibius TaxID=1047088 RepID=UPI0018E2D8E3|nr:nuclear autoantigen Sp-100-like [Arvicola amphibius]